MSTIRKWYQQALLAQAAYANFWDSRTNTLITDPDQVKVALIAAGFSEDPNQPEESTQAIGNQGVRLVDNWS